MSFGLIAKSTLWQFASQLLMAALSIITVKCIAIGLSKELAGNYNSAYGYLQLFGILADFGLYAVAVNEVSRAQDKQRVLGALVTLRAIILTLSLTAALAIAWSVPAWRSTPLALGITIAALVPFFTLLAGMIRVVFQVTYKLYWVLIAEVAQRVLTASLIGLFILLGVRGSNDLQIYHLFLFIGGIGAFLLFLISFVAGNRLLKVRPAFDWPMMKRLACKALPYGCGFLGMAMYRQFDVTLIALLRDDFETQNAYYGFVLRMVEMGFLLPTFLLNSVLPQLGDDHARTKRLLTLTLFIILLVGITAMECALFWSRPLMMLLTTDAYLSTTARAGSDTALMIMSVPLLLNGIVLYGFYVLLTKHAWRPLVLTMSSAAALSLISNMLLIPRLGFIGAALTSSVIHLLLAVALWEQSKKVWEVRLPARAVIELLAYGALLAIALLTLKPIMTTELSTIIGIAILGILTPIFIWIMGIVGRLRQTLS